MIRLRENIDLKEMTTFGLPAPCGRLVEFSEPETDLPELDRLGLLRGAVILGGGSNMLFTRPRHDLTVIHPMGDSVIIGDAKDGSVRVTAGAGIILDELCRMTVGKGWWGLENLSGIPGHIGGAAVQNVGAYGAEFKDVVESVVCYSPRLHEFVTLDAKACAYGYRDSVFKHQSSDSPLIVCKVTLRLSSVPEPKLGYKGLVLVIARELGMSEESSEGAITDRLRQESPMVVREAVIALRNSKLPDPAQTGSAGSFFKNPVVSTAEFERVRSAWEQLSGDKTTPLPFHHAAANHIKLSAAWLIDKAGCKPLTRGGAALWQSQPLVLVNLTGNATGADIVNLENAVISQVESVFGITLSPEVIHI